MCVCHTPEICNVFTSLVQRSAVDPSPGSDPVGLDLNTENVLFYTRVRDKVLILCFRVFYQVSNLRLRGCRSQHFGGNSSGEGPRWRRHHLQDHLRKRGRKLCHRQPKRSVGPSVCLSVGLQYISYLLRAFSSGSWTLEMISVAP